MAFHYFISNANAVPVVGMYYRSKVEAFKVLNFCGNEFKVIGDCFRSKSVEFLRVGNIVTLKLKSCDLG